MNPDAKKAWIKALLSGEYEQTFGYLKRGDSYCALGVLCDVYRKEAGKAEWIQLKDDLRYSLQTGDNRPADLFIPFEVEAWAGELRPNELTESMMDQILDILREEGSPAVEDDELFDNWEFGLISLNDDIGASFKAIARIVDSVL